MRKVICKVLLLTPIIGVIVKLATQDPTRYCTPMREYMSQTNAKEE